jgi:hypothetical protein
MDFVAMQLDTSIYIYCDTSYRQATLRTKTEHIRSASQNTRCANKCLAWFTRAVAGKTINATKSKHDIPIP